MKIRGENVSYTQVQCTEDIPFEQFQAAVLVADTMTEEENKHLIDKGEVVWAQAHLSISTTYGNTTHTWLL